MPDTTAAILDGAIHTLALRAETELDSADAMRLAQAASNLSNALYSVIDLERRIKETS